MKLTNIKIYILWAFALFSLVSCKQDNTNTSAISTEPRKLLKIPAFNADSTYAKIEKQLAFGYRVPGTEAHQNTIDWIVNTLERYGTEVFKQEFKASFFDQKNVTCTNIMAQINPELKTRVLLAAHFDSRIVADKDEEKTDQPILGADDGASGTAMLLEIARTIKEHPIGIGVDLLFFDAEDQGENSPGKDLTWALGSQHWSQNKVPQGYDAKFGILLDMVGSEKATFGKEENSTRFAGNVQDKIWALANAMGYSDFFQNFNAGAVNDDHLYVNYYAKIPMVDIINMSPQDGSSFGSYHHTHDDNLDIISKRTLRVVGQVVTAVLYNESNGRF